MTPRLRLRKTAAIVTEKMMKLSARNQLKGKVVEVHKGATTAHVVVDLGHGVTITSSITNEAADNLGLKAGATVAAGVTASHFITSNLPSPLLLAHTVIPTHPPPPHP